MIYIIRYKRICVKVDITKPKFCEGCEKKFRLQAHHMKYAYTTDEVRKNPQLAAENLQFLCFYCHKIGDAIRKIRENPEKARNLGVELCPVTRC